MPKYPRRIFLILRSHPSLPPFQPGTPVTCQFFSCLFSGTRGAYSTCRELTKVPMSHGGARSIKLSPCQSSPHLCPESSFSCPWGGDGTSPSGSGSPPCAAMCCRPGLEQEKSLHSVFLFCLEEGATWRPRDFLEPISLVFPSLNSPSFHSKGSRWVFGENDRDLNRDLIKDGLFDPQVGTEEAGNSPHGW